MSPSLQTIIALGIVAVAATLLVRSWMKKRKNPGCGGECGAECHSLGGAVSPEVKKLQAKLKH